MVSREQCRNSIHWLVLSYQSMERVAFDVNATELSKKQSGKRQRGHFCSRTILKVYLWLNFLLSAEFGLKVTLPGRDASHV